MASSRGKLIVGYDLAEGGESYTSFHVVKVDSSGSQTLIESSDAPISRRTLVEETVRLVREHAPDDFYIQINKSKAHQISRGTLVALIEGKLGADDLYVGPSPT